MIIPRPIKPGDKIRVVSTAGKVQQEKVLPAVQWFTDQGYRIEQGKHIFSEYHQFAGDDKQRIEDLQKALDDPDCSLILCSRGGYGSIRLMEQLDFTEFMKFPKWLTGYSDVTVLHSALNRIGIASIHGSMPPFFFSKSGLPNENLLSLHALLSGNSTNYELKKNNLSRSGSGEGELVGGNLSILCSLLGTPWEIQTEGKILFIEEIDEYLYHIDRMMHQLKLSGKLENLSGMIIGDFTQIKDNPAPFGQSYEEIIRNAVKNYSFPVAFGMTAGHDNTNLALPLGQICSLEVSSARSSLTHTPQHTIHDNNT